MGALTFGAAVALVATTAALVAASLRLRTAAGFLLAAYLVFTAEIVVVALALSPSRDLTKRGLFLMFGVIGVLACVAWLRVGRPMPPFVGARSAVRRAVREPIVAVLLVLALGTHAYLLAGGLTVPQSSPDTVIYHLPRAALWKQQHAVDYVKDAPDERIDATPPVAEIQIAASMITSGGDRYSTLVQLLAVMATCVAIFGVARRLSLGVPEAAFGAVAYSTYTLVVLQTPTALNDLALAAPLAACAYFALGRSRTELGLGALALGLALGTKLTAAVALPVLAAFVLVALPRARWAAALVAGLAGIVLGSLWYVVNLAHSGEVDGGLSEAFPQVPDRALGPSLDRIAMLMRDFFELSGAEGEGWLWPPWPGFVASLTLVAVAVVLLLRQRRRAAAISALVGLSIAIGYPTFATWVDVTRRAARQALAIAGLSVDVPADRVPVQLYESSVHSSYGIAFALLLVWVGALAVRERRRGLLPSAALVALAAPLLFLVVFSLAIAYDPARMRFVAFPVALASSTIGIALRVRPIAWAATALTVPALAISVGYFAPRPAGFALLPGHGDPERSTRWFVQSESGNGDGVSFRFMEEQIPNDATVAVAFSRDTYLYPVWDAGLRRTILFETPNGAIPREASWLIVGRGHDVDVPRLGRQGWRLRSSSPKGWRIFSR